jgi:hypothetical protein
MRIIRCGPFPIKFKNAAIITFGNGAHSAEFTVDIVFYDRVTRKIVITAKFAQFRHVQLAE